MVNIKLRNGFTRVQLFHDGVPYHIETSPLICSGNHWTGFYMIGISIMKDYNISQQRQRMEIVFILNLNLNLNLNFMYKE